ncbi:ABC-type amino acid transport substrate-binding protein [Paraburkholderia sp. WC7.3g]
MRIIQTLLYFAAFCSGMFVGPAACVAAQSVAAQPVASSVLPASPTAAASAPAARRIDLGNQPFTSDFDAMLERRLIRVLVPYSRTLYLNEQGHERGLTAGLMRDFERYVNKKYQATLGKRPLTLVIIPTTRDQLIPGLVAGRGDIAAGNLTVTEVPPEARRLRGAT